jgi:hypothetical protein
MSRAPNIVEGWRTNARFSPSGEISGELSPPEAAGGEVRASVARVAGSRRTIREGSPSEGVSAIASQLPSGDQENVGGAGVRGPTMSTSFRSCPPSDGIT